MNNLLLRPEVFEEARNLFHHTTQEEKDNLVEEMVVPISFHKCIYGLMTEHCMSDRASELIKACVPNIGEYRTMGFVHVPSQETLQKNYPSSYDQATPIEIEIVLDPSTIPTIIKVIKGEIKENII